ncbi:hypothetical protein DN752_19615 [Echinicola strongylocentroti]|uniref:Phage gp6-like head-tail connector protein n=1 Tax=Echinicola strongylocentroti TaxID=1795355 RepID=A0A2Z4IN62_9BACT|nr:head-tail connector protein [Echinicola strongylocentroti]AWW32170.1 hypothetical protein DN752_19615 [Echinicola strongylocentroti]
MEIVGFKLKSKDFTGILTRDEAKEHLRIPAPDTSQDDQVDLYMSAAIAHAESEMERKLSLTTYEFKIKPERISFALPYPDFKSISKMVSVSGGTSTTLFEEGQPGDLSDFMEVDDFRELAQLTILDYPEDSDYLVITVSFQMDPLPLNVLQAIKMIIYHWYDNRSEVEVGRTANQVPMAAKRVFELERFYRF